MTWRDFDEPSEAFEVDGRAAGDTIGLFDLQSNTSLLHALIFGDAGIFKRIELPLLKELLPTAAQIVLQTSEGMDAL